MWKIEEKEMRWNSLRVESRRPRRKGRGKARSTSKRRRYGNSSNTSNSKCIS